LLSDRKTVLVEVSMMGIPRRYSHFVYGFIQPGLTCAIAAAIASFPLMASGNFVTYWLQSWLFSWLLMLPVVLFAAPVIRRLTHAVTREE
jgi:Protein of unknown function (DUF2798)